MKKTNEAEARILLDRMEKLENVIKAATRQVEEFPEDCTEELLNAVWALDEQ